MSRHPPSPAPLCFLGSCASLLLALALPSAAAAAPRSPDPDEALGCVRSLAWALSHAPLTPEDLERWFAPPAGPLGASAAGIALDRERLMALLSPQGPLGEVLATEPEVEAVVQGPDYARVILSTQPRLSFVLVREGADTRIHHWESTHCGDCREPVRYVSDLLFDVRERLEPSLVPGLDLHVERGARPTDRQQALWNHAFAIRNNSAGYLRWLLHDAEVLGYDVAGVRVAFRDHVETWPVIYRDGRWGIDYEQLPPESALRLPRAEAGDWREDAYVRQQSREWWLPGQGSTVDGGQKWAEHAVGVAWQPVQQRWLLGVVRPDGLLAGLFSLEEEGSVAQRWELPHWPSPYGRPVHDWPRAWSTALSPAGDELLLAGAQRWWLVGLDGQGIAQGQRGVLGSITAAAWSDDGDWLALGDDRGNVGLIPEGGSQPSALRYFVPNAAGRPAVVGLAFPPGASSLLTAWSDGGLGRLTLPELELRAEPESLCCGRATDLVLRPGHAQAVMACGGGCPPLAVTTVPLYDDGAPTRYADVVLSPVGGVLSLSPDGRWVVLASDQAEGSAALCLADDLVPVAVFSEVPLVQVAWSDDSSSILTLREDASAVHWTLEHILEYGNLDTAVQAEP